MHLSVGFSATPETVAEIDRIVIERRRSKPEEPFSRSHFVRQATLRALADARGAAEPKVRTRERPRAVA